MKTTLTIQRLIEQPVSDVGSFELALPRLKEFATVPWKIPFYSTAQSHKAMPLVAMELNDLNPDRAWSKRKFPGANPFFHHCSFLQYYIAYQEGVPVGRIAAFVDRSYRDHTVSGDVGWVGLFESTDDDTVGEALLDAATSDLKGAGAVKIIGPARFNANGEDGLLVEGFDVHPMVMEPYHPPYYARMFERWGVKENDWYAIRMAEGTAAPYMERLETMREQGRGLEQRFTAQGIRVRNVRMRDWKQEIAKIKAIYNAAWDSAVHPQFEQFSEEEFDYLAAGLRTLAIEDLVFIVEDVKQKGHPAVGIAVTLPDLNEVIDEYDKAHPWYIPSEHVYGVSDFRRDLGIFRLLRRRVHKRRFKYARVFILGTIRKKSGIDAILYELTYHACLNMGIKEASGSQIADSNPEIVIPLSRMGSADMTWRVYRHV